MRAASDAPAYDVIGRPASGASPSFTVLRMMLAEDVVVADDAQLVEHVAREVRPAVVERRQQAEDPEVAVQLHPDHVDDLDEVVQALHRVVLRLDRDDHAVRRDEAVDRQQAEVRRAVDQHVVVDVDLALEGVAQDLLAAERREQLALGGREVDVRRRDVDAGASRSAG